MTNRSIIEVLHQISELLEIKNDNKFKIRAYVKLAQFLSGYEHELEDIYKKDGLKGLTLVPNLGEGIGMKIAELLDTGKLKYLDELKNGLPLGVEQFLKIPGMGPKTAFFVADTLKVRSVEELEEALKEHKLKDLKGFGEKTEEKILKGIEIHKRGHQRKLLGYVYPIAEAIIEELKAKHKIIKIEMAGSIRRMKETVGDIDILVVSTDKSIMDTFCSLKDVSSVISKGPTKASIYTVYGIQVDLRLVDIESYGAAVQYFTGCKEHNVLMREIAVKAGFKLNEYGLYNAKTEKLIAGTTEEEVYNELGLQYIPPELREGSDEIIMAIENKIPKLLELKDIKGDMHCHSLYSDGHDTIENMAAKAMKHGYEYISITDHSQSLIVARGLKPEAILKQEKEIDKLNENNEKFKIFKSTEVDILEDGSLDYPDSILKKMDLVIGSVHSHFNLTRQEMTKRFLKAMDNKYLTIIGHISGRVINHRDAYELDYEEIFKKAVKTGTVIEINANPERLDLIDIRIKEAIKMGVKVCIGTDAHTKEQLDYMKYGVGNARRGWAMAENILNTMTLKQLSKWLASRK
ncbi:MAG: DNA polymerase/3'-5' exonuclease PolX [bacterium]